MAAKAILILVAQALFIQGIFGQCIPSAGNLGAAIVAEELAYANNVYGAGPCGYANGLSNYGLSGNFVPSSGGSFAVTSYSPISPTGVTVISENAIEGALAVNGELPFLGAVVVEGNLPTAGAGGINYGCGNGAIAIVSEGIPPVAPAAFPAGPGYAPGLAGGFNGAGVAGRGYGGLGFGLGGCGYGGVY